MTKAKAFDAVVAIIHSEKESKDLVTKLSRYHACPVVAFVGLSKAPNDFEGAKAFASNDTSALIAHLRQLHRASIT